MAAWLSRSSRLPRLFDLALALVLTVAGLAEVLVPLVSRQGNGSVVLSAVGVVLRGVALTQRRTHPLGCALTVFATLPVLALFGTSYILFYGQAVMVGVALFAVARHPARRARTVGIASAAVLLLGAELFVPILRVPTEIAFDWAVAALVVVAALSLRTMAARARASQRRAVEVEVAAAERTTAAVVAERARIARELHDIVAHAVSTIIVQAGAAEQVVDDEPQRARASLHAIRATGTSAMGEMRRLVTVLRDDDSAGSLEPQPGLDALPGLLDATRTAGLDVDLQVCGTPRALPAGLDLAAFRIIQEGVTNTRRHSSATRAVVEIAYDTDRLRLRISDAGPRRHPPTQSGGHGLVGIRERAELYGGTADAGPDDEGGFRVDAHLAASP